MDGARLVYLVDSHCHLNMLEGASVREYVSRAEESGVGYFLNVSVSMNEFPALLQTAEAYPNVSVSVGLHPNEQDEEVDTETLVELAQHPKVIAVGETGLDYYRSTGDLEWQKERFRRHISAAKLVDKPLIIHTRQAKADTFKILTEENAKQVSGVMHCFTEDWDAAKMALDLGFYISFSGIVTFKNATIIQEVAKLVPLNRMLIETDSPYLAPNPYRGKQNEPGYVRHTAEFLAELRHVSLEELAKQTTENFFTLFKGAPNPHV
jgi:TatD DNase family protein